MVVLLTPKPRFQRGRRCGRSYAEVIVDTGGKSTPGGRRLVGQAEQSLHPGIEGIRSTTTELAIEADDINLAFRRFGRSGDLGQ